MDFATWFQDWLTRHPLKAPATHDPAQFTAEVMQRVRANAPTPAGSRLPLIFQLVWGRLALAAVAAAVVGFVVLRLAQPPAEQVVRETAPEAPTHQLAALPKPASPDQDLITLAESPAGEDETWLEGTVELLEALEEDLEQDPTVEDASDEEWLKELELLDQSELAASS